MKKSKKNMKKEMMKGCDMNCTGSGGCFYFLGFIGSLIYYLQQSTGFWNGVLAVLKSLVWPVFLIYKLLAM